MKTGIAAIFGGKTSRNIKENEWRMKMKKLQNLKPNQSPHTIIEWENGVFGRYRSDEGVIGYGQSVGFATKTDTHNLKQKRK